MEQHAPSEHTKHYRILAAMIVLSFISMYILMYSMVNSFSNVFPNTNQFYMASLMTMPMIIIEIVLMRSMYMNRKWNIAILSSAIIGLIAFFMLIQKQAAVNDKQFLKSMIPHHGAAILMAKEAIIQDPEIKILCEKIIRDQQSEIEQMKAKLKEINKK